MVRTYGLTHIALAVHDVERSFRFYQEVFGVVAVYRENGFLQAQTPGSRDVLVFEEKPAQAGSSGGIAHFGFRLVRPEDIDAAAQAVEQAGGTILHRGEFCPGEPYVFFTDPDGVRGRDLARDPDAGRSLTPGLSPASGRGVMGFSARSG